jgi:hypothetical protein
MLIVVSACGGTMDGGSERTPDAVADGIAVFVEDPGAHWASDANRLTAAIQSALGYWGAAPGTLAGWTIRIQPGGGGLTDTAAHVISMGDELGPCVDALPMTHEVGHAALYLATGDPDPHHRDLRWNKIRPPMCR